MRVLIVTNYFLPTYLGGAEVSIDNSAVGLLAQGHDVRILSITTRGLTPKDHEHIVDGLSVHEVDLARRWKNRILQTYDPAVAGHIQAEIDRFQPDVLHTHNLSGASLAPWRVARRNGLPVVATLHDLWLLCANNMMLRSDGTLCSPEGDECGRCFRGYDYWAPIPWRRRLFRRWAQTVHTFISPSQRLIDLHVLAGYERTRFRLVRHGLRPLTRPPVGSPPALAGLHHGGQTLVFVGAIVVSKGIEVVLQALPKLIQGVPGFRLIVAGRGVPELEERLRGFDSHVVLLGHVPRSHIAEVYAGAGLTIMPSVISENSPLSVCESLMAGTPVLGARIGGIPELVVEGETGYLYEPNDPQMLAERAIAHFRRPASERRAMRRACMAYAEREFAVGRHVSQLEAIYRSALEGANP